MPIQGRERQHAFDSFVAEMGSTALRVVCSCKRSCSTEPELNEDPKLYSLLESSTLNFVARLHPILIQF